MNLFDLAMAKKMFGGSGGGAGGDSEIVKAICEGTEFELTGNNVELVTQLTINIKQKIVGVSLPNAKTIEINAFYGSQYLKKADFPKVTEIGNAAFKQCYLLSEINFPNVVNIGANAFETCHSLTNVCFPSAKIIGASAFRGFVEAANSMNLEKVDLPVATAIDNSAFAQCDNLTALILRNEVEVCEIDITAFADTKIDAVQGFIYIHNSMYEAYREYYASFLESAFGVPGIFDMLFRKIEDYPEICG